MSNSCKVSFAVAIRLKSWVACPQAELPQRCDSTLARLRQQNIAPPGLHINSRDSLAGLWLVSPSLFPFLSLFGRRGLNTAIIIPLSYSFLHRWTSRSSPFFGFYFESPPLDCSGRRG